MSSELLTGYGLAVGKVADLVVLPGDPPSQAVVDQPPRTFVIKRGRVVARNGVLEAGLAMAPPAA